MLHVDSLQYPLNKDFCEVQVPKLVMVLSVMRQAGVHTFYEFCTLEERLAEKLLTVT